MMRIMLCLTDFGLPTILSDPNYGSCINHFGLHPQYDAVHGAELLIQNNMGSMTAVLRKQPTYMLLEWSFFRQVLTINLSFSSYIRRLQVLTGKLPFQGDRDLIVTRKSNLWDPAHRPSDAAVVGFSDLVWELVEGCWHRDPIMRPPRRPC